MNIEEMKLEWKQYERRLAATEKINEKLVEGIIRERSRSRVSRIRRNDIGLLLMMILVLVFLVAILAGNPFDFRYNLQYVPYGFLILGVLIAMYALVKNLLHFNVDLNVTPLESFLHATINAYERAKKFQSWFAAIFFSAGLLTAFSFLPRKVENKGLWWAIGETLLSMSITALMYFVAYRLGAFKDRKQDGFASDLAELQELKRIESGFGGNP